jgi:glycopeptide antibiotics resistance protein
MTFVVRHAKILLAAYSVLLVLAVFSPSSDQQSGAVLWLSGVLDGWGLPAGLASFTRLEVVMNAVIVAPASFLAGLAFPRFNWRDWTCIGFVASLTVEAVQGLLLPGRVASFSDVVANTAGALVGAVALRAVRSMLPPNRSG